MNRSSFLTSLVVGSLLLTPAAFAEEMTDDTATTTDASVSTDSGAIVEMPVPAMNQKAFMRDALLKNRERILKLRSNDRGTSRGTNRTLRRTSQLQAQQQHLLNIKERQEMRVKSRKLDSRLGSPNAGIRRTGIILETQRVENNAIRNPVGRMRLFPNLFQD